MSTLVVAVFPLLLPSTWLVPTGDVGTKYVRVPMRWCVRDVDCGDNMRWRQERETNQKSKYTTELIQDCEKWQSRLEERGKLWSSENVLRSPSAILLKRVLSISVSSASLGMVAAETCDALPDNFFAFEMLDQSCITAVGFALDDSQPGNYAGMTGNNTKANHIDITVNDSRCPPSAALVSNTSLRNSLSGTILRLPSHLLNHQFPLKPSSWPPSLAVKP
ncbi:hypothetical protein JB92DRAFT_2836353 [Gautieria morchelliformis]|nr:hypothetical protein JB92DRAFT_2836353 [Gautieria morchelliformis]